MKEVAQIHYTINSRSAKKLYKAAEALDIELRNEQSMDMSKDVDFQPIVDSCYRKLYRRYGIKSWQEFCQLMNGMDSSMYPLQDVDEYGIYNSCPDFVETAECPEHGNQEIVGYGSSGGPDPYTVEMLKCKHKVICLGPGDPMTIIGEWKSGDLMPEKYR